MPGPHYAECDAADYDGGSCTCDLVEEYGPSDECDDA